VLEKYPLHANLHRRENDIPLSCPGGEYITGQLIQMDEANSFLRAEQGKTLIRKETLEYLIDKKESHIK